MEATNIVGSNYSDMQGLTREVKAAEQYLPSHLVLYSDCNFNEILALLQSKGSSGSSNSGRSEGTGSTAGTSMCTMDFSHRRYSTDHFTDQNPRAFESVALNNVVALKNLRFRFKSSADKMSE